MPPKAKKPAKEGKDKKGKKDAPAAAAMDVVSVDELNQKIATLEKEKNKEEEYRNYMQLERDKINAFWEISKKELEDTRAQLRNKDREMEELEERHQVEIKVYKQKVKHLLYEHQNNISTLKADGELGLKLAGEEAAKREGELQKDCRTLKLELKEQELAHEEVVRSVKLEQAKEVTKLRQEVEQGAKELASKYERKMKALRDDAELRRKQEIHEAEESKNAHIQDLMKKHEKAFTDIKNYYNDITHNNLDLIKTLKEDVTEMKKKDSQNEKLMFEIAQENKRLSEPLQKAVKEVESLRAVVGNYEKDKAALSQSKARLLHSEKHLKHLEWENEVLQQRHAKVEAERDQLYSKFEASIYSVQQKTGVRNLLLQKKLSALGGVLEHKEAQLAEVMAASNLDPATLAQLNTRLEEVMERKNGTIRGLQYDLSKVCKAHNDLIRVYEAKLSDFGIPAEELGFRPLIINTTSGPANRPETCCNAGMSCVGHLATSASFGPLRSITRQTARLLCTHNAGKVAALVCHTRTRHPAYRTSAAAIGFGLSKALHTSTDTVEDLPWLIVGLGNPGARYDGTRHNVGFQVLDTLAGRLGVSLSRAQDKALQSRATIGGQQVVLAKPITFMNVSGEAVGKLTRYYKIPSHKVLVVHDDLDLPTGKVRLRARGGHGGHNGMRSITQHLKGSQDFPRLKIGIGRPAGQLPVASFVLQAFNKAEATEIDIAVQECCDIIHSIMAVGLEKALSGVRA